MIVSVPAPPPMLASPPPCPACNSTAVARISESRIRMPTRIPYMRGARYLGDGGAHKLRPATWIERRSADEHTVQLRLCQQLSRIFQVHAAAIENEKRRDGGSIVLQPTTNCAVHFGGVLWRRVASCADCPNGLVRDRHATLGRVSGECRLELAGNDRQRLARLALRQCLTDAQEGLQIGGQRCGELFARLLVGFPKHVPTLGMADQCHASAGLRGEGSRDGAGKRALRFPVDVLRTDQDIPVPGDILRDRLERNSGWEKPHRPLVGNLARRKERAQVLPRLGGPHIHLPVRGENQASHASSSAATPGNSFPSKNSSDAPPPVETWVS